MKGYKGFDKDLKCYGGYQYEIGRTETTDKAELCHTGFHFCERPLDVFSYFAPAGSRYCEIEAEDVSPETEEYDSKRVAKKLTVKGEIGIAGLVKAQIEYVKAHCTHEVKDDGAATAGDSGAATAGYRGAATAGYRGAATAGYRGAATAGEYGAATAGSCGAATAGYRGAATAGDSGAATAGYRGAATAGDSGAATAGSTAGYRGAATAGEYGAATSRGNVTVGADGCGLVRGTAGEIKIRGGIGAILVICAERETNYNIAAWKAAVVDGETIKADTWYTLQNGEFVEVQE